jgi:UDP-glucose 4-epimerase
VIRDYIHVSDVAKAYVHLAEANLEDHVFNVGSGKGHSLNDILRLIHEVTGQALQVRYTPGRVFDVPANVLDIRRICSAVHWKPMIPLDTGIECTWEWVQDMVANVGHDHHMQHYYILGDMVRNYRRQLSRLLHR